MITVHSIDVIVSDPAIKNGDLIVAGSGVRVLDLIASHVYRGLAAEELAVNFALDLAHVYAALAYYYQHKGELDEQLRVDAQESERLLSELEAQGKLIRLERN